MMEIRAKIAEQIAGISPKVEDAVIESLVSGEVYKRTNAIVQALEVLSDMEKSLKKVRPDQQSFDVDGTVVSESYSKAKLDERNKLKERIEKHSKAIEKALNGDMADVYKFNSEKS